MTKKALVSTAELKRMALVANEEGVTVEIEREGTIVRVMPFQPTKTIAPKRSREEEAEAGLAQWLADRDILPDGRDSGRVLLREGLAQLWPNKENVWCGRSR